MLEEARGKGEASQEETPAREEASGARREPRARAGERRRQPRLGLKLHKHRRSAPEAKRREEASGEEGAEGTRGKIALGLSSIRDGRDLASKGQVEEAYEKYVHGLQRLLQPDKGLPEVRRLQRKIAGYIEEAESLKDILEAKAGGHGAEGAQDDGDGSPSRRTRLEPRRRVTRAESSPSDHRKGRATLVARRDV